MATFSNVSALLRSCLYVCQSRGARLAYSSANKLNNQKYQNKLVKPRSEYLYDYTRPVSEILSNLTPEDQKRLEAIREEHMYLFMTTQKLIPKEVSDRGWVELLASSSHQNRLKVYAFEARREFRRLNKAMTSKEREELADDDKEKSQSMLRRFILRRIPQISINKFYHSRLFSVMDSSQNLVLDMSFEEEMRLLDLRSAMGQLRDLIALNRVTRDPYHIVFSNLKRNSNQFHFLSHLLSIRGTNQSFEDFDQLPYTRTEYCILEAASQEERRQYVYLTPDSKNDLIWEPDKIYVIGNLVDKVSTDPLTLLKAKRLGIKTARLPMMTHLGYSKVLNMNHVAEILLSLKMGKSFGEAFKCIPTRFVMNRRRQMFR